MKEKTLTRLLKLVFKNYGWHCLIVFLCIIGSAFATVQGTLFMQSLIDDYIMPMIGVMSPNFSGLLKALLRVGCFFGMGIVLSYGYQRIMVNVTQGF